MNLVNLTPHEIKIIVFFDGGNKIESRNGWTKIPPSGKVARIEHQTEEAASIATYDNKLFTTLFETATRIYGEVIDLPKPDEKNMFIVSSLVLEACPERKDILAPDTGDAIRNEKGEILAVKRFIRNP